MDTPGNAQVIDLQAEAEALMAEPDWRERDRHSRTIVTAPGMRLVLTALRGGAEIGSEGNDETLAVQVLQGSARLEVDGGFAELAPGRLAAMARPGRWRLRAETDALLLLTAAHGSEDPQR